MNENDLKNFAQDVQKLLNEYDIDVVKFAMNIQVTPAYFETAKVNFPDRTDQSPHPDLGFARHGEGWAIAIMNYQPRSLMFDDKEVDSSD